MDYQKKSLTKIGLRLITSLFYQEIECKKCGARWRKEETSQEQNWLCPKGCNAKRLIQGFDKKSNR